MVHGPATYARNQGQRVPDVIECRIAMRIRLTYADPARADERTRTASLLITSELFHRSTRDSVLCPKRWLALCAGCRPRLAEHGSAAQVVPCFGYCVLISYRLGTWSTLQSSSRTVCSLSREVAGRDGASGLATNFRTSSRPGAMRFGVGRDVRSRGPCFRWPQPTHAGGPHGWPCRRSAGAKHSSRSPRAGFPPR